MIHWALAVPFLVCLATSLVLVVFYNPDPLRPYRSVFSWAHRLSGLCLILFPILVVIRGRGELRVHLKNIRQAFAWTRDDMLWLFLMLPAAAGLPVRLPEQGKFNAAEKLNFMMVLCTYPLFVFTGVLLCLPGVAFLSWILHLCLAAMAAPLVLGHIFMATINPSTRVGLQGMITGYVDRQWARHHYSRWYREEFTPAPAAVHRTRGGKESEGEPASILCPFCKASSPVGSWTSLLASVQDSDPVRCEACGKELAAFTLRTRSGEIESILAQLEGRGGGDARRQSVVPLRAGRPDKPMPPVNGCKPARQFSDDLFEWSARRPDKPTGPINGRTTAPQFSDDLFECSARRSDKPTGPINGRATARQFFDDLFEWSGRRPDKPTPPVNGRTTVRVLSNDAPQCPAPPPVEPSVPVNGPMEIRAREKVPRRSIAAPHAGPVRRRAAAPWRAESRYSSDWPVYRPDATEDSPPSIPIEARDRRSLPSSVRSGAVRAKPVASV
jgi:formate dehydrogenase subunit gamma